MFNEAGNFALALALALAVLQAALPLPALAAGRRRIAALAEGAALGQCLCLLAAFAALTHAYLISDFSLAVVAANSHSLKPLLYKIAGVWGNHEGSLLLWVLVLAVFGAFLVLSGRAVPPGLRLRTLAVQGMISTGFLLFMVFTSNPFARLAPAPLEGAGLNPLLQHPGLAFHPPVLYLGYVGVSVVFSFAVAALLEGKVDAVWARWVRPWALVSWVFLTAGIALGSWWAYYELGWGGFWFWDPVENASFMPWLLVTALLHSAIVAEKRDTLKSWTILLAICAFSLSLMGTFLVRSGILTSVHAFATDPDRGFFILLLLLLATGGALTLYAWRAPLLASRVVFRPVSREGALLLNNLLLAVAAGTVFIGTLYPLLLDLTGGGQISVGAPYFNLTFVPLALLLALLLGFGPLLAWKRGNLRQVWRWLARPAVLALLVLSAAAAATWGGGAWVLAGFSAALWTAAGAAALLWRHSGSARAGLPARLGRLARLPGAVWGMTLAHLGVAVVIAGVTGAALLAQERILVMTPGQTVQAGGYEIRFDGVRENVPGPNYSALQGLYSIRRDGAEVARLIPERRRYAPSGQETTEAAVHGNVMHDLYLVIGNAAPDGGGFVSRIYYKPLAGWLWFGSALMMLGGLVSLADRRWRVGAPDRSAASGNGAGTGP